MEGVAFALLSAWSGSTKGTRSQRLRLIGGAARSTVWPSIIAAVFGCPVDAIQDSKVRSQFTGLTFTLSWDLGVLDDIILDNPGTPSQEPHCSPPKSGV